jgi:3-methyladenine DNA glycosylase/8-oxoguanine DNA glycosylase
MLSRVERLADGVATLTIRERDGHVVAQADRPLDDRARAQAAERIARTLQLDADMAGFHQSAGFDRALAAALRAKKAGRILAGATLWEDVVKTVCATNTTWRQAVAVITRIAAWDPDGAFPGPEAIAERGEETLRQEARAGYRARSLARAAQMGTDGDLEALDAAASDLPADELLRGLRARRSPRDPGRPRRGPTPRSA